MLELVELSKAYRLPSGERVAALDRVNLTVARGELVALYGPSGSGKSTLLRVIAGLLAADSGSVLVDGSDISTLSSSQRARYRLHDLGYVDQAFDLLQGASVAQNAAFKLWLTADAPRAEQIVRPLLVHLGLGARLESRPSELSMGERQRVVIARALSTGPKLVLADEPTGNLDSQRTREVLELLRDGARQRGAAVLLVTHDPHATAVADRAHALRDGRLHDYRPQEVPLDVITHDLRS